MINGATDPSIETSGGRREHVCVAVGVVALANGALVETEVTAEVLSNGDLLQFLPRFTILSKSPPS